MKKLLDKLSTNNDLILKLAIYIATVITIVYLFPRGGQFKYQFQKGRVWQYDDLYAPFDFAIAKDEKTLASEKNKVISNKRHFFTYDNTVKSQVKKTLINNLYTLFDSTEQKHKNFKTAQKQSLNILEKVYHKGLIKTNDEVSKLLNNQAIISLKQGNIIFEKYTKDFFTLEHLPKYINAELSNLKPKTLRNKWAAILTQYLKPNIHYDNDFTETYFNSELDAILPFQGFVPRGSKIIEKGDVIEELEYAKLKSINNEYKTLTWSKNNQKWLIVAYTILIAIVLLMLLLFIQNYRPDIAYNNTKVSFIFLNIIFMVLATTLILKYNPKNLYIIPFTISPLVIKAFFDPRMGLFTHVMTVLILGFIVPNSFEFIFIQTTSGIVTVLTVAELNKRANLFLTVAKITGVYLLSYLALSITYEGNFNGIDSRNIYLFILNGLITVSLIIPLIFTYEKIFNLVSNESLKEFSDTNHPLLKELNEKAPGTFQHSVQVANIAEEAAKEIKANTLLVRAGALYHDIGKMKHPIFFTENQNTGLNPHLEITPEESAYIIIDHVILGIEIAKKHRLPDRIIDFIRSHHGSNLVYYFYKKEEEYNPDNFDINKFKYPGPIPFSKETAIVMISDACEAASKSLRNPTAKALDTLVDKIVKNQMDDGQYNNANITFRDIERVKKVVKRKLHNIYHTRIEYPE